jgi:exopolysaccharide production protein ExoZ
LEFAAGVLIGAGFTSRRLPEGKWGFPLVAAAVACLALTSSRFGAALPREIAFGFPAALLVLGAVVRESSRPLPVIRPLRLLGDASYSIYLIHFLSAALFSVALRRLNIPWIGAAPYAAGVLAAIAGGVALYFAVERPLVRFFHRI